MCCNVKYPQKQSTLSCADDTWYPTTTLDRMPALRVETHRTHGRFSPSRSLPPRWCSSTARVRKPSGTTESLSLCPVPCTEGSPCRIGPTGPFGRVSEGEHNLSRCRWSCWNCQTGSPEDHHPMPCGRKKFSNLNKKIHLYRHWWYIWMQTGHKWSAANS